MNTEPVSLPDVKPNSAAIPGPSKAQTRPIGRQIDPAKVQAAAAARQQGATLRAAAAAAGVSTATLCRWQAAVPWVKGALRAAREGARQQQKLAMHEQRKPGVVTHSACPRCGAGVAIRHWEGHAAYGRFWRCARWPLCAWASWRPRHPRDCPACGAARYWSLSRKSVGCPGCGRRENAEGNRMSQNVVPPDGGRREQNGQ